MRWLNALTQKHLETYSPSISKQQNNLARISFWTWWFVFLVTNKIVSFVNSSNNLLNRIEECRTMSERIWFFQFRVCLSGQTRREWDKKINTCQENDSSVHLLFILHNLQGRLEKRKFYWISSLFFCVSLFDDGYHTSIVNRIRHRCSLADFSRFCIAARYYLWRAIGINRRRCK